MRDSVDSYMTAYSTEGSDPVGYPYGLLPEYTPDDIPMAETAYGATFGDLGRHRRRGHGRRGGWWGGGPWYPYPYEQPIILVIDESEEAKKKREEQEKRQKQAAAAFANVPPATLSALFNVAQGLTPDERNVFLTELRDPKFAQAISWVLDAPDPVQAVRDDALCAIANEFSPGSCAKGQANWTRLRKLSHEVIESMSKLAKTPGMADLAAEAATATAAPNFLSTLISSAASAFTALQTARIQADTAEDIAQIKADAAAKQAELQAKMAQAAAVANQAASQQALVMSGSATGAAGIPWLPIAIGVGVLGLGAILLLKK